MLQIEIFENRNRSLLLCGGFPVCQRYTRRQKSLLYSFPLSPSSSGQGRHPFKVDIAGSNPAGGTTESEKPVTNSVAGFLLPMRRDSNPTGCGAEETRSVFQRSTQGAKRRGESGRRQPHADIPLGAPFKLRSPLPSRWRAFCYRYAGIRTRQGADPGKSAAKRASKRPSQTKTGARMMRTPAQYRDDMSVTLYT